MTAHRGGGGGIQTNKKNHPKLETALLYVNVKYAKPVFINFHFEHEMASAHWKNV